MPADKIPFLPKAGLFQRVLRLYYTLRPLRWEQYWYRIWYPVKKRFYQLPTIPAQALLVAKSHEQRILFPLPVFDFFDPATNTFFIHNRKQSYTGAIDWNDKRHGMLWAYHLNYFGWLRDENVLVAERLRSMRVYAADENLQIGLDSYPTSLRSISWIRFLLSEGIREDGLNGVLYEHCHRLLHFPEFHIQGNHLWENGCAMLIAGFYFNDADFTKKGKKIFLDALREQVLADGGHVEGSPMYHALLLSGLLQCIEIMSLPDGGLQDELVSVMRQKAAIMLGWLGQVTFRNGDWPQVNDSTNGVAPTFATLMAFADSLGIRPTIVKLKESGYRMLRNDKFELFMDIAPIQPYWQPGHAHADTLNFCLHAYGKPLIVDPGISTYEIGPQRSIERSTFAHNTITSNRKNSSDVWRSFRVGRRAAILNLEETKTSVIAAHNGFGNGRRTQIRSFGIYKNKIIITDQFTAIDNEIIELNLHFQPGICLQKSAEHEFYMDDLKLTISGATSVFLEKYYCALAFNSLVSATKLRIETRTPLSITIENITC